jgi:hypothetical protein
MTPSTVLEKDATAPFGEKSGLNPIEAEFWMQYDTPVSA